MVEKAMEWNDETAADLSQATASTINEIREAFTDPINESLMRVYSVYDVKAKAYLPPFFAPTDGVAIRLVTAAVNDANHDFHKFVEDYSLFRLGHWSEKSGALKPSVPEKLITCMELVDA